MLLKDRFQFKPADYSNYFAFIGLTYAFSQLISRAIINRFGKDQTHLLIVCLFSLMCGRYVSATTLTVYVFYGSLAFTVCALGIVNTSISTTITRIASDSNVGGLMGVLDTSEKLAGIVGPAIGGGLYDNVLIHGQPNVPILEAERFDPATQTWTVMDAMEVPRMYHSTAALLPDGRVLAGGHVPLPVPWQEARETVSPQVVETRLEIYEPGYLFRGPRPVIDAAPEAISYGDTFDIEVRSPAAIDSVLLMRPAATTHAFDMGQRGTWLEVVDQDGTTMTLRAPPNSDVTPAGHHMLFVNSHHPEGPVPSEAAWVHLS